MGRVHLSSASPQVQLYIERYDRCSVSPVHRQPRCERAFGRLENSEGRATTRLGGERDCSQTHVLAQPIGAFGGRQRIRCIDGSSGSAFETKPAVLAIGKSEASIGQRDLLRKDRQKSTWGVPGARAAS